LRARRLCWTIMSVEPATNVEMSPACEQWHLPEPRRVALASHSTQPATYLCCSAKGIAEVDMYQSTSRQLQQYVGCVPVPHPRHPSAHATCGHGGGKAPPVGQEGLGATCGAATASEVRPGGVMHVSWGHQAACTSQKGSDKSSKAQY
jgi:hypothetical protein